MGMAAHLTHTYCRKTYELLQIGLKHTGFN